MARRIFSGILIALSSIFLLLSVVGIGAAWYYNEPLTQKAVGRLEEVDAELVQTQTALRDARLELERTLRLVDSAEKTLSNLKDELVQAKKLFDEFDQTLGDKLIPGLENSKARLNSVKDKLESLKSGLEQLNSLPIINLNLPGDEMLSNLIDTVDNINTQIDRMKGLADQASTFAEDISFLMGGDFSETRQRLQTFVQVVDEYEQKVSGWHTQVRTWIALVPIWIDRASIILTFFLLWFGLSQFALLLNGLTLWRGGDPFLPLRREPVPVVISPDAYQATAELGAVTEEMEAAVDELNDKIDEVVDELEEERDDNRNIEE